MMQSPVIRKLESGEAIDIREILKFSGAFIAWVIGSGFATGQEILRFFTSFGLMSYGVVLINLLGFLIIGKTLMITGYQYRTEPAFNHFEYFCGKRIGAVYFWATPVILFLIISVLFSAAGAMFEVYFNINHAFGTLLMAVVVWGTYLIGFERFVKIVSKVGPLVILFCLSVGAITVFRDYSSFGEVATRQTTLGDFKASSHWALSAMLYLSLDFLTGGTYFTNLGASAKSYASAKWGAILGAIVLVISIAIMNTAILLNAENASSLAIPTLFLAQRIGGFFGGAFSMILFLGMFSSCSATLWSVCSSFFKARPFKNKMLATGVVISALILGLLPFGQLVGIFFPLIGYYGLFYIGGVGRKWLMSIRKSE